MTRSGSAPKARRSASSTDTLTPVDGADVKALVDTIKALMARVAALESAQDPPSMEQEFQVASGDTITIAHHFGAPVRFWPTWWAPSGSDEPAFGVNTSKTTADLLVLTTVCAGRVVIRVEKASHGVT